MNRSKTMTKPERAAACFVISILAFALCGLAVGIQPELAATIAGMACVWVGMGFAFMGILYIVSIIERRN